MPKWLSELVKTVLNRYGLTKQVFHSKLYELPEKTEIKDEHDEIKISKEILDHFYFKDAYRVNTEALAKERAKFREYEAFNDEIKQIAQEVSLLRCSLDQKEYTGKEALNKMAQEFVSTGNLDNLMFNSLYFLTGKVENLLRSINGSTLLSENEIEVLERKMIFAYTENFILSSGLVMSGLLQKNLNDGPYGIFTDYVSRLSGYIQAKGY